MKCKLFTLLIILFANFLGFSQGTWDSWDKNYPLINIDTLLNQEKQYALAVESDIDEAQLFLRMGNYRLELNYANEKRVIDEEVKNSMIFVYKTFGNPEFIKVIEDVKYEYKFEQNGNYYWLASQAILDKSLKKELKSGRTFVLYCLFLNQHKEDKTLYNSFLISEFRE